MNLRYVKTGDYHGQRYDVNCPNIAYYAYWEFGLPNGIYKAILFGLHFWFLSKTLAIDQSGVKIDY
jgi:hypothetical protein